MKVRLEVWAAVLLLAGVCLLCSCSGWSQFELSLFGRRGLLEVTIGATFFLILREEEEEEMVVEEVVEEEEVEEEEVVVVVEEFGVTCSMETPIVS